jgi:hypothetical protein
VDVEGLLVLRWAHHPQRGVEPYPVVEQLYELGHGTAGGGLDPDGDEGPGGAVSRTSETAPRLTFPGRLVANAAGRPGDLIEAVPIFSVSMMGRPDLSTGFARYRTTLVVVVASVTALVIAAYHPRERRERYVVARNRGTGSTFVIASRARPVTPEEAAVERLLRGAFRPSASVQRQTTSRAAHRPLTPPKRGRADVAREGHIPRNRRMYQGLSRTPD